MNLEQQIINQLFHNERYGRAILPYLVSEYFVDTGNKIVFEHIQKFVSTYGNLPTPVAIGIELEQAGLPQQQYDAAKMSVDINTKSSPVDYDWLVDQTEKYAKDRAIHNALRESITILDDEKKERGAIEELLRKALSVSFDGKLGLDVLEDAERQYDTTHALTAKIPFMIEAFNRATQGGSEEGTLNVIQAGCVHPDTTVVVQYEFQGTPFTTKKPIKAIESLLNDGLEVKVLSPQGFVKVLDFVDKGLFPEYVLRLNDGTQVRCNEDHMFKTNLFDWMTATEIAALTTETTEMNFVTMEGLKSGQVVSTNRVIPIVDIVVDTEEHSYYTNGVESHNTNVGKSLILCHLAGDFLLQGYNVLYVTYEMSEEKIASRVYANILDIDLDLHKDMPKKWFLEKIEQVKKNTPGKLMVKEYPSGGAHAGHIRHHMQELKLKKGFVPKIIIFDYIGIAASSRYRPGSVARHVYLQGIAQEFRGLCQESDASGWTAVQVNRAGFDNSDPTITDIAEAWGIPHEADWYLVVSQPEEFEELGQFLCRQEKSRYSDKGKMRKFTIGVDKGKQRVFDVDQNQQSMQNEQPREEEADDRFSAFTRT